MHFPTPERTENPQSPPGNQGLHQSQAYVPAIDGIRTIAVLAVIIFHLGVPFGSGGFLGVDIFFVISGYLITNQLYRDIRTNRFSVVSFYQRRIARIAPASFFVIAITLGAATWLYSAQDLATVGLTAATSAASITNLYLLLRGSYFAISPDSQPLMHFWSLGLEEQFYLIFPVLLYCLIRYSRRWLLIIVALLAISYALCVALATYHSPIAFYLLPTRAWELLVGSVFALMSDGRRQYAIKRYASSLLAAGLALVVLSFLVVEANGFPGWSAALPVTGTILMIVGAKSDSLLCRILASPGMVYVGKRSYSLYLWHWPVFSFADYALFQYSAPVVLGVKLISTAGLTELTHRLVENPARGALNSVRRPRLVFALFAACALTLVAMGYFVRSHYYLSAWPRFVPDGGIVVNSAGRYSVVLVGDSIATTYAFELADLAKQRDVRLHVVAASGYNELPHEEGTLWPKVRQFLEKETPDAVIVAQAWDTKLTAGPSGLEQFRTSLDALLAYTPEVVVILQPPEVPATATRQSPAVRASAPVFEPAEKRAMRRSVASTIQRFRSSRVEVVSVEALLHNPDGSVRMISRNGQLTYQDRRHLSSAGTRLIRTQLDLALRSALGLPS